MEKRFSSMAETSPHTYMPHNAHKINGKKAFQSFVNKFTKNFAILFFVAILLPGGLYTMYLLNSQKMPSLQCLASVFSRCNPVWSHSWLAGRLWNTCDYQCTRCKGASYGICTSSSLQECFNDLGISTKCYCYGHEGNRRGSCWY